MSHSYPRYINTIFQKWLPRHEVILIYGARQVGKTTFIKNFVKSHDNAIYYNCENQFVQEALSEFNSQRIAAFFGDYKYICLDEGQSVGNIGKKLKFIHDELPQYKVIVTGSSSFELTNEILEPLTGRNISLKMHPLGIQELSNGGYSLLDIEENLHQILIYGLYPEVFNETAEFKSQKLIQISSDYMFKDVLIFEEMKRSAVIRKILKYLAYSLGSEISTNKIANEFAIGRKLVDKYLDLLEKMFIVFPLSSFSRNRSNELKKKKKYYFYDNGLRNAIINDFNIVENRGDIGALWENFCVSEIMKSKFTDSEIEEYYFWRTYDGAEIDLVQEKDGLLNIWEFKWNEKRKVKFPSSFIENYDVGTKKILTRKDLYYFNNLSSD